ncbi:1,2-phenylacetyl-CoA epoxidase subunit PaaE [Flindersiella endophytica]
MSRRAVFHPLRVGEVERLTDDSVAITFGVPAELADDYRFMPGQHVTVRTPAAGDDLRRNYSICSSIGSGRLTIGVKYVPGGGFSAYALKKLQPGDEIDVMTPTGRFCTEPSPERRRRLGLVAAGSGITPVLSILSSVLEQEPGSSATLLYGNRSSASVMFLEELQDLKDRFPARFQLVNVLSRERPGIELLAGRIDGPKLERFLDTLLPPESVDEWYLCGPHEMVDELRATLRARGVPRDHVHTELFHVGPVAEQPVVEAAGDCELTAVLDGRRSNLRMARTGPSVLEAVLGARPDAPFACRGGVCGTCRAKLVDGSVRMDQCYALEPEEVRRGYVLTCQSHPTSDRLVVDYDA